MPRTTQTDEQRTLSFIETASKEQLDRLIDRAQLVKRVVYPDAAQPKPAAKRTRAALGSKARPFGAEKESAGPGFSSTV